MLIPFGLQNALFAVRFWGFVCMLYVTYTTLCYIFYAQLHIIIRCYPRTYAYIMYSSAFLCCYGLK